MPAYWLWPLPLLYTNWSDWRSRRLPCLMPILELIMLCGVLFASMAPFCWLNFVLYIEFLLRKSGPCPLFRFMLVTPLTTWPIWVMGPIWLIVFAVASCREF